MNFTHQYTTFLIVLTLLLTLIGLVLTVDANRPFMVCTIYFQATDVPEMPDDIPQLMLQVQDLYRNEMARNNYGPKTFRLEMENGQPKVHVVKGKHNIAHYSSAATSSVTKELPAEFKNPDNIHLIIVGGTEGLDNLVPPLCGAGWNITGDSAGGIGLVAEKCKHYGVWLIAHELGHAFGLGHRVLGDPSVMNTRTNFNVEIHKVNKLKEYETRWLDQHHYFNDIHEINDVPKITKAHALEKVQPDTVLFRFDVRSRNDLHYAQLTRWWFFMTVGWDDLIGNRDTAEFHVKWSDIHGESSVRLQAMDTQGNIEYLDVAIDTKGLSVNVSTENKITSLWADIKIGVE